MIYDTIKYFDVFGTKFSFYTDEKPRLYTLLGGLLSILLIIVCIILFILYGLDDFERNTPIVTTSFIPSEGYHKIKFGEEKIWIPWRISDYDNKYINHENLIYPIFTYYSGVRNNTNSNFNIKTKKLNYKLCNETSMINKPEFYRINVPLSQLYCIDMDDLEMGGAWISLFINYVTMDFYLCEDGIDFNETNLKCTTQRDIMNRIGKNNSLEIELYYPVVQFQPTNISYPIIILYEQIFYQISKFTNKIDRIFFQNYILKDDLGWIKKNSINSSYWGFSTINGDSYTINGKKDLIKEGSTSRSYSLNIYLQPGIIYYERKYKKIIQIITEELPIMFVVFKIFKNIAKIFKVSEENKKFFELLFENLRIKKDKFSQMAKKIIKENQKIININSKNNNSVNNNINFNNNILSSIYHSSVYQQKCFQSKDSSNLAILNASLSNKNNRFYFHESIKNTIGSRPKKNYERKKITESKYKLSLFSRQKNNENNDNNENIIFKNSAVNPEIEGILRRKKNYEISKLFPYRYYFYSIFLKNIDITKITYLFSKKFTKVYKFVGKMFDISTYLTLLREFQILKRMVLKVEEINMIETPQKINVSGKTFLRNMDDCITKGKFEIFSQNISKKFK